MPATFAVTTTLDVVNPADDKLSLREAVSLANNRLGIDTITLPAGVFRIILAGAGEDLNATGDFDITSDMLIRGAGAGATAIDGRQLDRVFDVLGTSAKPIRVAFQGLTVRNGKSGDSGGGIQGLDANLVFRDCAVTGNQSADARIGGGIFAFSQLAGVGDVTLVRTLISRNVADTAGGIATFGVLTARDSAIRRNLSDDSAGGISAGTANLTNTTVTANSAGKDGGGISATTANLTNCVVSGNRASGMGGGIRATISATLSGCVVSGNSTGDSTGLGAHGGGIATTTANLIDTIVSGNSSTLRGGGISASEANLVRSTVIGNSARNTAGGIDTTRTNLTNSTVSGNSAGSAGGMFISTAATLTNTIVSGNSAGNDGGGLFATEVTLTNCTVSGNSAGPDGGGGIVAGTATLTNCTVSGNSATGAGGGLACGTVRLTNCTVSGNSSTGQGGGIAALNLTLLNVTVTENSAHTGGGVFHLAGGTSDLRNTIIAENLVELTGTSPDVFGSFTSSGHNLIGDGTGSTELADGMNGDRLGTAADPIDARLAPLRNNRGRTKTHALLAGSPAIDAGDNNNVPATDQRGTRFSRVRDGNGDRGAFVDIGAFER